jgi:hypothetical protein
MNPAGKQQTSELSAQEDHVESAQARVQVEPTGPRDEYTRRLQTYWEREARERRRHRLSGNARVVVVVLGCGLLWFTLASRLIAPAWLFMPVALFVALSIIHERITRAWSRAGQAADYYEKALARLDHRWAGQGDAGTRYLGQPHPYAHDIDLFGTGSLFELLCTARTSTGADTLASWLRAPASVDEIRARQAAIAELRSRHDLREDIALFGAGTPAGADLEALAAWGEAPWAGLPVGPAIRVVALILSLLATAALIGWGVFNTGPTPFLVVLLIEGGLAGLLRGRVGRVLGPVDRRGHDLLLFAGLLARLEQEPFTAARLRQLRAELNITGMPPSRRTARLARLLDWLNSTRNPYFALLALAVMWSTQFAFAIERWRLQSGPAIRRWLAAVGEFEALCALATYGYENPDDPFPEIVPEGPLFEGEGLGHPLIPRASCVPNDVCLCGEVRLLVVSGSNMSGKSTLLRTVGVNTVLALAGAPVRARRLRLSPLAVGASLRLLDSLQEGRSRFFAEITRVRQLVDLAHGPLPLLFLLDELFHGTNSHDRRLGAEAVVRGLVDAGAVGLITTHDLALTHIADQLAPRAANVHFEDHFENGAMTFDYRMRPGVVRKSNALALMRAVGLEV